jgi:uncharacterized protein
MVPTPRLVAFMQYVRVIMVAIVASIIARMWVHAPAVVAEASAGWFPPIEILPFFETLSLLLATVVLGPVSRIPAGTLLTPMFVGAVLQITVSSKSNYQAGFWRSAMSFLAGR